MSVADRLMSFVQRLERLDDERREIVAHMAEVRKEAKNAGFEPKVINQMLKERRMSDVEREEWQALCETYRAALGMLDGTPLGENARKRFSGDTRPAPQTPSPAPKPSVADDEQPEEAPKAEEPADEITDESLIAAQAEGAAAAKAGKRVTENPYAAADPRRAKWDEGWCAGSGSDGMDIPPAWRRALKKPASEGALGGDA